jgi:hypothetical protein
MSVRVGGAEMAIHLHSSQPRRQTVMPARNHRSDRELSVRKVESDDVPVLGPGGTERLGQHVYGEEAFRYFLGIERKRSERSQASFLLMLIEWEGRPGAPRFAPRVAARLFSLLGPTLRETDFVGWYHEGRVAGAVLTQLGDSSDTDVSGLLKERVVRALRQAFPPAIAARLQVRVYELPPTGRSDHGC